MNFYKSISIDLFLVILTVQGWPMPNMNNQMPQGQSWPWMPNNDGDKSIDAPKSMSYPIPSNGGGMSNFDSSMMNQQKPFPPNGPPQTEMWSPNNQDPMMMMNQETQFNGDDFPYNRPYRNQLGQGPQYPMMMMQPPQGGGMPMQGMRMGNPMHHGMPQPRSSSFGQGMNPNRIGGGGGRSTPEFYPQSSPFDFLNPRYPVEYSPSKTKNASVPAITIHYNVTYTFSPMGWKPVDVTVDDADFHSSITEKAIDIGAPLFQSGGGIVPAPSQNEMKNNMGPSGWSWWPKKNGAVEIDDNIKLPTGIHTPDTMTSGFGQMPPSSKT